MEIRLKTSASWWTVAACLAAGLAAGFWLGRWAFVTGERVRVTELPEVTGGADRLTPVEEIAPVFSSTVPRLVFVSDTVFVDGVAVRVQERIDTAAIIRDYETRRKYSELLFDSPDLGRLNIEFGVQYNHADSLRYSFVPVRTEVTRYVKRKIDPFVMIGYGTLGYAGVGGGAFWGSWGATVRYEMNFTGQRGVGVGLAYRF